MEHMPPKHLCGVSSEAIINRVFKTMAYSLLMILALTGNSLIIAVIWKKRRQQTIINFLIFNMAISDLLTPVLSLPPRILRISFPKEGFNVLGGIFGSFLCKFQPFGENTTIVVSVLTLEVIAIERFYCVVYPFKKQPIDSKIKCFVAIVFIWITSAALSISFFVKNEIIFVNGKPFCFINSTTSASSWFLLICFVTIIPFVLLSTTYGAIIVSLHRQKESLHLSSIERRRRIQENRRVTYMSFTILLVFSVSWLLFSLNVFVMPYVYGKNWSGCKSYEIRQLQFVGSFFTFVYTALNPFIYFMFNENYRKGFLELLCLYRKCGNLFKSGRISPSEKRNGNQTAGSHNN